MQKLKNLGIVALLVLVIVVVLQNTETIDTQLLFVTISMPRALLLFLTLLIGTIAGVLLGAKMPRRKEHKE